MREHDHSCKEDLSGLGKHMTIIPPTPWITLPLLPYRGFTGGSNSKESACNVGGPGLIPGLGRSPSEGNVYPSQYSCLENSMGSWLEPGGLQSMVLQRGGHNWAANTFTFPYV